MQEGPGAPRPLLALDSELFFLLCLCSRVCDVATHLLWRKAHRHGVVVDADAEGRHENDIYAEREDPCAAEVYWAQVGEHPQPDKVRPQPRTTPKVEPRDELRRVD